MVNAIGLSIHPGSYREMNVIFETVVTILFLSVTKKIKHKIVRMMCGKKLTPISICIIFFLFLVSNIVF